ncbi:aminomethyl transferase family protein [Geodermatophilus sabuli]|uniref:Aminomethyl transferase family protein n=1 Tax=Geodermatophilus sabuli TaxID=1564158 RepID=A0A7K3VVR2_9ACTN|nr:aminomethyl transferase family protein [Geodermatophilus sabuli]NEK56729.1 aminomethyl transferase family protein [Geodermatophilus sabuli]
MTAAGHTRSLQDLVDATPDLVAHLYNDTPGPHSRVRSDLSPVPAEFTNWRDEQRAWRETAILFDQSHHMPELYVKGPDALALLSRIGVNSLANLTPGMAKQFIGCNSRGQMIGDCVLYDLGDQTYELVSSMPLLNWVEYHAQTGDWDVTTERDNNTSDNPTGRRLKFRFQLDGPTASEIFDEVVDGETPEIRFFRTARVTIAGVEVLVLRHGMAGHKGVEISGPYEHSETVRAAILAAGAAHGLRQGGTKAYFSTLYEQAWVAYPLPAVYTGDDLRGYREWLPADGWEGKFSIAGSFVSSNVEDYYVTPYDLGYGHIVKFDHDFIGREALERVAENPPRRKVTLVWEKEDVLRVFGSLLDPGVPYKYIELPVADYGNMVQRDEVRTLDGRLVGLSTYTGYSSNERKILSLGLLDTEHATIGDQVTLLWGEPDGGSRKPRVERHQQILVRATVAPAPYASTVQQMMRSSVGGRSAAQ